MDWSSKQATAKKLLDKFGAAMEVVVSTPSTYTPSSDSFVASIVTYDTIGVILSPTMVSPEGVYSKSDKVRLLLNGSALPALDASDFKVIWGSIEWRPDTIVSVKPGGTVVLWLIDCK